MNVRDYARGEQVHMTLDVFETVTRNAPLGLSRTFILKLIAVARAAKDVVEVYGDVTDAPAMNELDAALAHLNTIVYKDPTT